jgi:cytoskeletal protein CcmA (bactofilin family)
MKSLKHVACIISIALATSGAQAAPLLSGTLSDQTVFSHTYTTTGASLGNQTVWGNILANQDVTLGAGAKVSGSTQSRDLTTGDGALVSGNTTTVGDTSIGANAIVKGDLKSVDLTVGANGTIEGDAVTVADSTLGDSAKVVGILQSGAAVTIGANAVVDGLVEYGTALVVSASATTLSGTALIGTTPPATVIADEHLGVTAAQTTLNAMAGTPLATGDIATSRTFTPGVYNVTGLLTTTAGITLTLDAQNQPNAEFIFNVSIYLSFGAGTIIDVINTVDDNTSVVWNTPGGYTSVGANAKIVGTILANTYVSTGAYSTVTGSGDSCGGVFSATSYVTIGANATVGQEGCVPCSVDCDDEPEYVEADICLMTKHDDYNAQTNGKYEKFSISEIFPTYSDIQVTGITQDEPTSAIFFGDTGPDGVINDNLVNVGVKNERADPSDNGDGRVYHINFTASSLDGVDATGTVKVVVPTVGCDCDTVIDSGQDYDSLDF